MNGTELGHARVVLESVLGVPFSEGNGIKVLRDGDEVFPALLRDIRSATRSIDLLWFLGGRGAVTSQVARALAEGALRGVRVRVLLDGFGAKGIDRRLLRLMRTAGCDVRFYRRLHTWRLTALNKRTHRRVSSATRGSGSRAGPGSTRRGRVTGAARRAGATRGHAWEVPQSPACEPRSPPPGSMPASPR